MKLKGGPSATERTDAGFVRSYLVLPSISDSYHHRYANSIFIGSMCAFAAFLWSYQYSPVENRLGNWAAVFATGVAVFPTPSDGSSAGKQTIGYVHFACASTFFFLLGLFCRHWTISGADAEQARTYRFCQVLIWSALGAAALCLLAERLGHAPGALAVPFLVLEIVMVEAFGVSWLVRGGVRRVSALSALLVVVVSVVAIVFILDLSTTAGRVVAGLLGLLTWIGLLAVLWRDRPTGGRNRFGSVA